MMIAAMPNPPAVSVVLPTYNEAGNILPLIDAITQEVTGPPQIIVVDDDSPDGTWRIVQEAQATRPHLRLIHRVGRRGLTSALNEGIAAAGGDVVVWMDCDFSMPPATIPALVAPIAAGRADVVVGSRYAPGGRDGRDVPLAVLLSRVINTLAHWLFPGPTRDFTSGFIAARRVVLQSLPLQGDYGEYCIRFLAQAQRRYRVEEVPYACLPRTQGESKTATNWLGFIRRGRKYLYTLAQLSFQFYVSRSS